MYSSASSDDEDEPEQEDEDEPEVLVVEQYVQRVLVSGDITLDMDLWLRNSTASSSHLMTMLPESGSRPLPAKRPGHAT